MRLGVLYADTVQVRDTKVVRRSFIAVVRARLQQLDGVFFGVDIHLALLVQNEVHGAR